MPSAITAHHREARSACGSDAAIRKCGLTAKKTHLLTATNSYAQAMLQRPSRGAEITLIDQVSPGVLTDAASNWRREFVVQAGDRFQKPSSP